MDAMAVSWIFLIGLAVIGLLLIGGLVAIIALLINPNTRVAGIVLLLIVVLAVIMVGAAGFYFVLDADGPNPMPQPVAFEQAQALTLHTA